MMKVNFALFRLFERIVPIRRALFRNVHTTDEILGDSDSKLICTLPLEGSNENKISLEKESFAF